ncbi:hypothetical protein B0H16DRAFT_1459253 [Mycena metata]|uniref:Uncharacterized protein n=1 Tax=Mycena metata TaxID=1033252 RepID=A0AAD7NBV7_9AGAR|nr:hypothetical protein B0H16DRAFT_1459253 [Mycena metata]
MPLYEACLKEYTAEPRLNIGGVISGEDSPVKRPIRDHGVWARQLDGLTQFVPDSEMDSDAIDDHLAKHNSDRTSALFTIKAVRGKTPDASVTGEIEALTDKLDVWQQCTVGSLETVKVTSEPSPKWDHWSGSFSTMVAVAQKIGLSFDNGHHIARAKRTAARRNLAVEFKETQRAEDTRRDAEAAYSHERSQKRPKTKIPQSGLWRLFARLGQLGAVKCRQKVLGVAVTGTGTPQQVNWKTDLRKAKGGRGWASMCAEAGYGEMILWAVQVVDEEAGFGGRNN